MTDRLRAWRQGLQDTGHVATTIPIVFAVPEDPVGVGLVASLSTSQALISSQPSWPPNGWVMPGATHVGVLLNPVNPNTQPTLQDVEAAARSMGIQIRVVYASTSREIDAAFASLVGDRPDALFVGGDSFFLSRRLQLATLAPRDTGCIFATRLYRSRRANELLERHFGCISAVRRIRWPNPQGCEARRIASIAVNPVQARDQQQHLWCWWLVSD
jgi:hypothetical protein